MNKLVQRLRDGCIYRKKRWSGDTHFDLGGSIDEERTDALLGESAAAIERLQAIATAAFGVWSQREAGTCQDARLVGWEELEIALHDGPRKQAAEAKEKQ